MCGIAGYVLTRGPVDNGARLQAMGDSIRHRGPDGEGFHFAASASGAAVGLAHRRLAIIDLVTGDQPMIHPETGAALVFNGEIYNFGELRTELEALGHVFRTQSDTEVLLNAYVEWGTEAAKRLRGMFAFALWDPASDRLVLGRDPFGKKPLYLYEDGDKLLFGSEPKALLAFGIETRLDRASIGEFLSFKYVPGPHTLFAGIRKLMPGTIAVWREGTLVETSYFIPPYGTKPEKRMQLEAGFEEFGRLLDESVRIRMVSDVPYGAFLSGGIDSSALVALMSDHTTSPVNTFAVGFEEARYSELEYAKLVAERFSTRHTELTVRADDLIEHIPTLIDHSDGPIGEASNIPIYLLSREAARSVKMVLTGEGSDELLGGYPRDSVERFVGTYQHLVPGALHRGLVQPMVDRLPSRFWRLRPLAAALGERDFAGRMQDWLGGEDRGSQQRLLRQSLPERALDPTPFTPDPGRTPLERILYFEQRSWLPDNLLERGDRLTMAASIEGRMPFMDTQLAALLARLPDAARIKGFTRKVMLRRLMRDRLPSVILNRPKLGFRVPVAEWFRGTMRSYVRDTLGIAGGLVETIFDRSAVERVLVAHETGARNNEKLIWMLLNLQLFQQRFRLAA